MATIEDVDWLIARGGSLGFRRRQVAAAVIAFAAGRHEDGHRLIAELGLVEDQHRDLFCAMGGIIADLATWLQRCREPEDEQADWLVPMRTLILHWLRGSADPSYFFEVELDDQTPRPL